MSNQDFLKRAGEVAMGSGCLRAKVGVVITRDEKILVEAFNLVMPSNDYCKNKGCLRDKLGLGMGREAEKCRSIHAEARAISEAAQKGIDLNGAIAFVTFSPCLNCAKLLWSAGIKEVYFLDKHSDETSLKLLEIMGVKCQRLAIEGDDASTRLRDTNGQ